MPDPPDQNQAAQRQWHVTIKGKKRGPLSANDLHGLRIDGKINAQTLIWREGMQNWQPLAEVPELAALAGYAPSKPPAAITTPPDLPPPLPSASPPDLPSIPLKTRIFDFYATRIKPLQLRLKVLGFYAARIKPLQLRLKRIPSKWIYMGALIGFAVLACSSFWRWRDMDAPVIEGRRLLPERRIALPTTPGLFAVEREVTLPLPGCGAVADSPAYNPKVEFLLKGDFATDSRADYTLSQMESAADKTLQPIKTVRCLKQPMAGRADLLRLIPMQILTPGYYQLNSLGCFVVQPEPYKQVLASRADNALQASQWDEALAAMRTWILIAAHDPQLNSKKQDWSKQLLARLNPPTQIPIPRMLDVIQQVVEWQPELQHAAATTLISRAQTLLKQGPQSIPEAESLLRQTIALDTSSSNSVAAVAWISLAHWLNDPSTLGKAGFHKLWSLCEGGTPPENVTSSPAYQLAQSLDLLEQGERPRALLQLEALASAADSDTTISLVVQKILALPSIGRKPLPKREPVIFHETSGQPALTLDLLSVEVTTHAVMLSLNAHNQSTRPLPLFYSRGGNGPNPEYPPLYILDDNGQKFDSKEGYSGGRQWAIDTRNQSFQIKLEPDEQATLLVSFPQVSRGATAVEFVSPQNRSQSNWSFSAIQLKAGPFDPPLTDLPLLHSEPVEPTATPVAIPTPTATPTVTPIETPVPTPHRRPRPSPIPIDSTPLPESTPAAIFTPRPYIAPRLHTQIRQTPEPQRTWPETTPTATPQPSPGNNQDQGDTDGILRFGMGVTEDLLKKRLHL